MGSHTRLYDPLHKVLLPVQEDALSLIFEHKSDFSKKFHSYSNFTVKNYADNPQHY